MKNWLKYMILAGVAFVAAACEQEPLTEGADKGGVHFAFDLNASRAAAEEFTPEQLKVRIYRPEGADSALIRRYTAMEEIPTPLYLISGDYSVKVEAGDRMRTAFVEEDELLRKQKLCYEGWAAFRVARKQTSTIEVACPTINVRANLKFDTSDSEIDTSYGQQRPIYENRLISGVKITLAAITTSTTQVAELKQLIAQEEAPVLTFQNFEQQQTASGYFLMPEGVTTLVWGFEGEHATDGTIARVGKVTGVKPGHAYSVNFRYKRTPDGYAKVEVEIDDSVEVLDDKWYFKPQPEISGAGIDAAGVNIHRKGSDVVLVCESINDLVKLSLGGVAFFEQGQPVADAIEGVSCVKNETTKATITIRSSYFDTLAGGVQTLEFGMQDAGGSEIYPQQLRFKKQGLVADELETNLWQNTAKFSALVENAGTVAIRYRRVGAAEWNTLQAAPQGVAADGMTTFVAHSVAGWISAENRKGHAIYKPDLTKSIFAENSYEYQLLLNGEAEGPVVSFRPTVEQSIEDGGFNRNSLSCFGNDTGVAPFWGSGNNSFTTDDPLCRYATYTGMEGVGCARLSSCAAGAFGVTMLAAGNLFTGTFNKPSTTGTVRFGVKYPLTARPTALKFKYWGRLGTVDRDDKSAGKIAKGQPDEASIIVAIVAWPKRHEVTSGTGSPTGMWSPEDGAETVSGTTDGGKIIGYGVAYPTGTSTHAGMVDYEVPIVYYDTTTQPDANANYTLVISAATSRYGDYMNGSSDSDIYLDDMRWSYSTDFERTFPTTTY
ncbi:MAG: PCMD domain-containing protein [Alistipes sp.]|nr:PCMD domain-containing protein [Alistipes sp.]